MPQEGLAAGIRVAPSGCEVIVWLCAIGLAGLAVGLGVYHGRKTLPEGDKPLGRLRGPRTLTWDYKSWSTNLAVGAALLTALVGPAVLPATPAWLSQRGYLLTTLLLAALVGLAPLVYGMRVDIEGKPTTGRVFVCSAFLTLSGTFGQLALLIVVLLDLLVSRVLSLILMVLFVALFVCVAVLVFRYAVATISRLVALSGPGAEAAASWSLL